MVHRPISINIHIEGNVTDDNGLVKERKQTDTYYFSIEEATKLKEVLQEQIEKAESALTDAEKPE